MAGRLAPCRTTSDGPPATNRTWRPRGRDVRDGPGVGSTYPVTEAQLPPSRFGLRAARHRDVDVTGARVARPLRRPLGRSLAVFQVGESGTGEHLCRAAEAEGAGPDYVHDLRAFVAEEQEHARLLALVLAELNHPLRDGHWTDAVFVHLRRLKSLRTEVLTLLVAEVVAVPYYRALRDGVGDPRLSDLFGRIHADELRHIEFHAATLPHHLRRFSRPVAIAVRLLWNVLTTGASVVVAVDHGRLLRRLGVGRARFAREVWSVRRSLDHRLFEPALDDVRMAATAD